MTRTTLEQGSLDAVRTGRDGTRGWTGRDVVRWTFRGGLTVAAGRGIGPLSEQLNKNEQRKSFMIKEGKGADQQVNLISGWERDKKTKN